MASTNYINECKNDAYKNRLGKIEIAEKKVTTGTSIKIEKGADSAIDLTLYGRSTQETTQGKQLFNYEDTTMVTDGITVDEDGWITATFDNTNGTGYKYLNFYTNNLNLKNSTTYAIVSEIKSVSGTGFLIPVSKTNTTPQTGGQFNSEVSYNFATLTNNMIKIETPTTIDDFSTTNYGLRTLLQFAKGQSGSITFRLSVLEDTSVTADTFVYEKFTGGQPSPSPDYPSPIESVGRKNLFDVNSITENTYLIAGSGETGSSSVSNVSDYIFVKANQSYYLSYSYTSLVNTSYRSLCYYDTNKNFINGIPIDPVSFHTFTPTQDGYVRFSYDKNYTNIQLEKGTVATDYVPYEHTEISATVTGKNLFDKDNVKRIYAYIKDNTTWKYYNDSYSIRIPVKPNANYVISADNSNETIFRAGVTDSSDIPVSGTDVALYSTTRYSNTNTPIYITTGANAKYIVIQVAEDSANDTFNTLQLEKGTQATTYEQYKSNSLTIDLQGNELCSLPNGTKDEINITNGKSSIVKRTKEFILDENKTIVLEKVLTNTARFLIYNVTSSMNDYPSAISTHFKYLVDYNSDTEHFYITRNGAIYLFVNKSIASTVDELKTWLSKNNVKFLHELAEPETINLGTVEMPHTYEGISNITNSADTEMTVKAYEWTGEITNYDNLQSIQIDSGCYTDGNIIGSVYVECLNASFVAEATNLVDKIIRCQIGVKYADLSTEYICKGKYIIERPNNEITAQMSQITAYSDLYTNLEAIYICNLDYSAGNITLKDVYIDVCKQLGLTPLKTDFLNSTIPIKDNPFKNNEKNRVVLQTISKIACSFVNVYEDNNQIDLCWLSENAEPDYTFEMSDYVSVEGGQVICGPINCLIIKNSQIDDENVTIKDDESIKANGEHSITISDDYILHNAELRQQAITSIWNRVKGLKYVDCKLITYYGKPFLKLGNKIRVYTSDTDYFDTYVLKHKFEYDGAFASTIESPALTEQEIKTKQDISLGKALTNVQIDLDKQKERITSTVTTTNALQDSVSNLSETVQEQANQMQTLSTTLTQTNQSLQAEVNQINESLENGVSNLKNKLVTIDINGIAVSTNTSAIKAIMNNDRFAIKNGNTEAFYVGYDENLKKSVSRMNDLTITDYFTAGYHRQEKFEINGEQRTGWFYVGGE